jgi:hypothetical protein
MNGDDVIEVHRERAILRAIRHVLAQRERGLISEDETYATIALLIAKGLGELDH